MRAVVPISLCNPDLWSGWWTVGSRYTDKNGRVVTQTYGNLRFELSSMDEVTIKGMYDFSQVRPDDQRQVQRSEGNRQAGSNAPI
jgi:hypothetical protein